MFVMGRVMVMALAFTLFGGVAMAQQPGGASAEAASKTFSSAADVMALIAKARAEIKPDQAQANETILQLAPYTASLEYRRAVAAAAVHENEAEVMYVIDGSGTITLGGKLVNEKAGNGGNITGTGIDGGTAQPFKKGDWLIVPEKTPHWISQIDGVIVLMTLHIPRPLPGK